MNATTKNDKTKVKRYLQEILNTSNQPIYRVVSLHPTLINTHETARPTPLTSRMSPFLHGVVKRFSKRFGLLRCHRTERSSYGLIVDSRHS